MVRAVAFVSAMLCALALLAPTTGAAASTPTGAEDVPVIVASETPPLPGDTLSVDTSTTAWGVAYWTRNGVEIPYSANEASYVVETEDLGTDLAVVASADGGLTQVTSAPVAIPAAPRLSVTITGQEGNAVLPGDPRHWYVSWPTVTSTCTAGGAPIVYCPDAFVVHDTSRADIDAGDNTWTLHVTDANGVSSFVEVALFVDTVAPQVRIAERWAASPGPRWLHDGATYLIRLPRLRCEVVDAHAGRCPVRTSGSGINRTVRATGHDDAGHATGTVARVHVCRRCIIGAAYADGRWQVRRGATYLVKTVAPARPALLGTARPDRPLTHPPVPMRAAGSAYHRRVWSATVRMPTAPGHWELGFRVGGRTVRTALTVR